VREVKNNLLIAIAAATVVAAAACGSQQTSPEALATSSATQSIASIPAPTSTPQDTVAPLTLAPVPSTAAPTARPANAPTARPTAAPTARPTAVPTAPPRNLCGAPANPWNYNFCGGGTISAPPGNFCDYFNCIPSFWQSTKGYVEQCHDGLYSHSGGRSGSCSSHGGNLRPLDT
jgi:hypothetical protein